jgi:hypothetical protein
VDYSKFKDFFQSESMVRLVNEMAKRYGKLPHEILTDLTIFEYEFNSAFLLTAMIYENKAREEAKANQPAQGSPRGKADVHSMFKTKHVPKGSLGKVEPIKEDK